MADPWTDLGAKLRALAGGWASYAAFGSFSLYLLGYLSLRFHLTTLGVTTDLAVLDERYLFAGARFLVYLAAAVPNLLVLALPAAAVLWLVGRLVPAALRAKTSALWADHASPSRLALAGVVLSVVLFQWGMRECFLFSDLLVAPTTPGPGWMQTLLFDEEGVSRGYYFSGLLAGLAVTLALLLTARARPDQTASSRLFAGLLAGLVGLQLLMLPVVHGTLLGDTGLPRLAPGSLAGLKEDQEVWLVWEGKETVTFLVRPPGKACGRTLVALGRKDLPRLEIVGTDSLRSILTPCAGGKPCGP